MSSPPCPVLLIAGPTASGKSALAARLAREIGGEVVNADSMQVYRDLRILTARPTPDEEASAPHHMFGMVDGAQAWSVGHWLRDAVGVLEGIATRRRPAIVVGGTGLYFMALTQGLAEIPTVPDEVRATTHEAYGAMGEAAFRDQLAEVDPAAAARISQGDRQRLVRALAVHTATGRPLSDWQAATEPTLPAGRWRGVVLAPPRDALSKRCDARLAAMANQGALEEVAALLARNLDPGLPVMKALGVAAFAAQIRGNLSEQEALEQAQAETRRYAKRQTTWLRNQAPDWPRVEAADGEDQWQGLLDALRV